MPPINIFWSIWFSLYAVNILHINIEDVGGIGGYALLLEEWQNPKHPEYEHLHQWAGAYYDPELFSVQQVNSALAALD